MVAKWSRLVLVYEDILRRAGIGAAPPAQSEPAGPDEDHVWSTDAAVVRTISSLATANSLKTQNNATTTPVALAAPVYVTSMAAAPNASLDAHHLDPLSEQPEETWTEPLQTQLDRVVTLCPNCHRVIHQASPALTLAELRNLIRSQNTERGEPYTLGASLLAAADEVLELLDEIEYEAGIEYLRNRGE